MRSNSVKRKLKAGGVAVGTMVFEFNTSGIVRIATTAGAEFALFDMEHSGWSVETIRMLIATSDSTGLVPMVRVPATEYHFIARVMDVGAMGVMVPMVGTEQQARQIVEWAQYPPAGRRGAAFGVAHDGYEPGDVVAKMQVANEEKLTIVQIETVEGLENVDAIAGVDGVDVLWVGQFDLTNSMGIPGQFDHPEFVRAIDRVADAVGKHGKTAGIMVLNVEEAHSMHQRGFRCLAFSGDIWIYQQALQSGIREVRAAVSETG